MSTNYKFNNSCEFCYECPHWRDRNNNGLGVCTNKDSKYNGKTVHAMSKCSCKYKTEKSGSTIRVINQIDDTSHYIEQKNAVEAWNTAKAIAMEEIEGFISPLTEPRPIFVTMIPGDSILIGDPKNPLIKILIEEPGGETPKAP